MGLLVFIAEKCAADAEKHGLLPGLLNLKNSVELSQNLTGFNFFGSSGKRVGDFRDHSGR